MAKGPIYVQRTFEEKAEHALRIAGIEAYGDPRKVWVEDGHVLVESFDGKIVSMTPEVAIKVGRMISEAGAESLINNVMGKKGRQPGRSALSRTC